MIAHRIAFDKTLHRTMQTHKTEKTKRQGTLQKLTINALSLGGFFLM